MPKRFSKKVFEGTFKEFLENSVKKSQEYLLEELLDEFQKSYWETYLKESLKDLLKEFPGNFLRERKIKKKISVLPKNFRNQKPKYPNVEGIEKLLKWKF